MRKKTKKRVRKGKLKRILKMGERTRKKTRAWVRNLSLERGFEP